MAVNSLSSGGSSVLCLRSPQASPRTGGPLFGWVSPSLMAGWLIARGEIDSLQLPDGEKLPQHSGGLPTAAIYPDSERIWRFPG